MTAAAAGAARLLVVDDDPLLLDMAAGSLRHAGFDVTTADTGERALALFERERFALVVLDVVMPGLDGYQVCVRMRRLPQGATLPILVLTGLNDTASIDAAYQAGATDFIAKPIHWTLLAQRARYALRAAAAAESAERNRQRLQRAQRIASMGSWEIAGEGAPMRVTPELEAIYGVCSDSEDGRTGADPMQCVHPDDRPGLRAARQSALAEGTPYQMSFRINRLDGAERTLYEQAVPVFDAGARRWLVEGTTQDITARVEAEQRISHLVHHDHLTGLPNREFFGELAALALERAARLGTVCAMLHVDIDRFKSVNDAFGQAEGDQVLRLLTERLQASVRSADLASVSALSDPCLARVGGNAFNLLLVEVGGDRQASVVAQRLLSAVSMPIAVGGRELTLTASVGIAMYPRDASEPKALARCCEQAAYEAKAAGRAQQRFFDAAMNELASVRLTRESELRCAIGAGQLRLHYQPKVDATSGRIVGAEALVRWQHPERGLVPPAKFVPLAEECGLILPLTRWVLETACADLRRRADAGLPAVPVAVNLAAPSFMRDDLVDQLRELLVRHRLGAASIVLEVTETLLMKDVALAARRLTELRACGFRLSLDDFGTGYSSLGYLQVFAVDELKIDRSFIAQAGGGARDGAIARSIIALGREFGLHVVAEGVETASQAAFLVQHGCTSQQGFLYAKPMPREAFDELLRRGVIEVEALADFEPTEPAALTTNAAWTGWMP